MDIEKIDAVGRSLGVKNSDIKRGWKQKINLVGIFILQLLVIVASWVLGYFISPWWNLSRGGYPFSNDSDVRLTVAISIMTGLHAVNGIILLPKDVEYLPSRAQRIKIFLGNLIISCMAFSSSFMVTPWYGVYDEVRASRENTC
ncbi:MAG: hypothetical protein RBG13Loki_2068 [Promethearchaeota archaeon CR_4]|nr:MAG: hypothetical protein RBG13Loki_2068 [Candidatus Lokiarchaeota archaeon CR_4]